jgi:hypothetical protein
MDLLVRREFAAFDLLKSFEKRRQVPRIYLFRLALVRNARMARAI